jgi:hypothetical protein
MAGLSETGYSCSAGVWDPGTADIPICCAHLFSNPP